MESRFFNNLKSAAEEQVNDVTAIREKRRNLFPPKLISNSKRSNFENRIKWTESRGSERNGPFGEY